MSVRYYYDDVHADFVADFFPEFIHHVKGEWARPDRDTRFHLEKWQSEKLVKPLFGWKRTREDGVERRDEDARRYRQCYVELGRKNGKSSLVASIGLYLLLFDKEEGCEIYTAARDREQARIIFSIAKGMIERDAQLSSLCKVYKNLIEVPSTGAILRALSADAAGKHGYNAHGILFDEVHAQPNRELWDALATSVGARRQPLTFGITTAGFDRESFCYKLHEYAVRVQENPEIDPTFLPLVYGIDEGDDWRDEAVWYKANPNLGVSISIDFLRDECRQAVEMPSKENTFRRLYLSEWTESDVRWISSEKWEACKSERPNLDGKTCYGGLDLSTTIDTTAFVLAFPLSDDEVWVEPFFWVPSARVPERAKKGLTDYEVWARNEHLYTTEGNAIDYAFVRKKINELANKYKIKEIAIDRYNATYLAQQLQDDGFECAMVGQGFVSMNAPAKAFEGMVVDGKLHHGDHPVLNWHVSNAVVEMDAAGNIKPSKAKSTERIDGVAAMMNALSRVITRQLEKKNPYSDRGIRVF